MVHKADLTMKKKKSILQCNFKNHERNKTVTTGKTLVEKPYSGNSHVRFDEGEAALADNAEAWGSPLQTKRISTMFLLGLAAVAVSVIEIPVASAADAGLKKGVIYRNDFTRRVSEFPIPRLGETYTATPYTTGNANLFSYLGDGGSSAQYGFDFFGVYRMLDFSWWYASNVYGGLPSQDGWFQPDWLYGGASADGRAPVYHHQASIFRLNDDPCFRFWYSTATARAGLALHSLHNVFTSGVLRVQYDMRAPQRWDTANGKPVIVFPVFDKYMRSSAWNSDTLTWDCMPGAAGLRSGGTVTRAFPQYYDQGFNRANLGDGTRQLGNNYSVSGSSETQVHWFRFVLDYDLGAARFSGTVKSLEALHSLDAYDSEAHPTFATATTSAKNNTINSSLWLGCATNSTGALTTDMAALWAEKGGISGIGFAAGMTTTMTFAGENVISNKVFIDNIRVSWKAPGASDFAVAYENDFETRSYTTLSLPATTECAYSATTSAVNAFDVFNGYEPLASTGSNVGTDARVVPSSVGGSAYGTTLQPTGIDGWRRVYSPDVNAISTPFAYSGYSDGAVKTAIAFCHQKRYTCIGNQIGEKVTSGKVRISADAYLPLAPNPGAYELPPDGYGRIGIGIGTEAMYTALQAGHSAEVAACCGFLRTREEGMTNDYAYAAGPDAAVTPSTAAIGTKGSWYRLSLTVDMDARTYDASITPIGTTTVSNTATLAESPIYAVSGVALAANIADLATFYLWGYGYGDTVKYNENRRGAFTNIRIVTLDSQDGEDRLLYSNNFTLRKRVATAEPRATSYLAYHYDCPDGSDAWVRRNGSGPRWGEAIGTVRNDGGNQFLSLGRVSGVGASVKYTTPLDRVISNQTFTVRVDMRPPQAWAIANTDGRLLFGVGNRKMEQSQVYDSDSGRFVRFGFSCFDARTSDVCFNTNIALVAYNETASRVKLTTTSPIDTSHWYRFVAKIDPDAQTYQVNVYDKGSVHPASGGERGTLVAQSADIPFCGAKGEGACALDLYVCGAGKTVGETGLDPMQAAVDNIEVRLAFGTVILIR